MSSKAKVFLTGATGYVGGTVLSRLLSHPERKSFDITVLVRDEGKAKILSTRFGAKEPGGLIRISIRSSVLLQAHNMSSISRETPNWKLGDVPVLIHTSGSAIVMDDARGQFKADDDTIFDDLNVEQAKAIPPTALHRNVDLQVLQADQAGYIRGLLVIPPTIFGTPTHSLVAAGISNTHSIQIPVLIRAALDRKRAGMVGAGKPVWSSLHIDDTADLFITVFDAVRRSPETIGHGWEGFYLGENGESSWYELGNTIGEALVELGVASDPEVTTFAIEELPKYFGSEQIAYIWGSNCRCRASRARAEKRDMTSGDGILR